jgi:hypothetical protein
MEDEDNQPKGGKSSIWERFEILKVLPGSNKRVRCLACKKEFTGGASKLEAHLTGTVSGIARCTEPVTDASRKVLTELREARNDKQAVGKRRAAAETALDLEEGRPPKRQQPPGRPGQPTITKSFKLAGAQSLDKAIANFICATGASFNVTRAPEFLAMLQAARGVDAAYKPPSVNRLRGSLLDAVRQPD